MMMLAVAVLSLLCAVATAGWSSPPSALGNDSFSLGFDHAAYYAACVDASRSRGWDTSAQRSTPDFVAHFSVPGLKTPTFAWSGEALPVVVHAVPPKEACLAAPSADEPPGACVVLLESMELNGAARYTAALANHEAYAAAHGYGYARHTVQTASPKVLTPAFLSVINSRALLLRHAMAFADLVQPHAARARIWFFVIESDSFLCALGPHHNLVAPDLNPHPPSQHAAVAPACRSRRGAHHRWREHGLGAPRVRHHRRDRARAG